MYGCNANKEAAVMDWNLEFKLNESPFFSMLFSSRIFYHHNRNEVHYYFKLFK